MASLRVLAFDHEGRPIQFDTWLDDLQLYLLSDSRDSVLLFDHTSSAAPAPPATADTATRSQWLTRDAAARLVICNHLPLAECAHFGQHRTAQALYDAVVARYSSPATAALGRLLLPYLFPELSAFATVEDLISNLRTSDARYRAALPAEFLAKNPPPMDHFLALEPTALTVDLLEQHLLAAETSVVDVGAARGTPRIPFFENCSPSPLAPSYTSAAQVDIHGAEDVGAASASGKRRSSKGKGGRGGGRGSGGGGGAAVEVVEAVEVVAVVGVVAGVGALMAVEVAVVGVEVVAAVGVVVTGLEPLSEEALMVARGSSSSSSSSSSVRARPCRPNSFAERPRWAELLRTGVAFFDLLFDAILAAMYALSASAKGECYLCVPLDLGIEAATLGATESVLPGTAPAEALHTFTLDSGASRCFFHNSTTLTPHPAPVPVRLADPSEGPNLAHYSTVLPCPAVPSGSLSGHNLPSFSMNFVSTAALQDAVVTTTTPVGSSLYTLATKPPRVAASAKVSTSGQVAPPCSCRLLSHQTLLWHHRLGHPSLPRLRGMHSRLLVSSLPRSLPPLPPSPAPPCLPCVEGRQHAAPHFSLPPTTAPLQTLHMDVWGPARVSGQGRELYFMLVVDDFTRYNTVFPLRSKGQVVDVLIPWICAVCLQLRKRFRVDLPILHLHSDRGGEFSSDLLQEFCRGEGILQLFTLPDSPQQNGIAERRIGLVMEVARTYMIHAAAPHLLWPFAVRYAAHQLNLWPHVSLPETLPILRWTGKVGNASVFRVWGSRAFVRNTSADKLFACAIPCVFLGFSPEAPGWQFYHPTSCCVFPSQDVTFDESVPFYRVSQVDPLLGTARVEVAVGPGAASGGAEPGGAEPGGAGSKGAGSGGAEPEGAEFEGAESWGAEPWGAEPASVEPGAAEPEGVEPRGTASEGVGSRGAEPRGNASSGGSGGALPQLSPRPELLSPQQLREWFAQRTRLRSGAAGAGDSAIGDTGAGGAAVTAGAGGARGAAAAGPGGARTGGTRAAGTGGVGGAGAGNPMEPRAVGAGTRGTDARGAGARGAGAIHPGAGGAGGTVRPRPYFVPLLQQLASCPPSPVHIGRRVPRPCPPPVPRTHAMALRPSCVPLRVPLPPPPASSLPAVPDTESDLARAASPIVSRLLATVVTDPSFESAAASALVAELVDFATTCRLDYATALVAESVSASPSSVGGECAPSTDVLEDRQEDFECLAAAVPRFASMLLAPEGDPDAPDIPTPLCYAEVITGPYSSQWQAAMASSKSTGIHIDADSPVLGEHSRWHGFDYFQTFSPTPKMTTLWVLLHVAAQHDYELHSLDFSIAFLQGSLHQEIWLRRPPAFTGLFPAGTQWSLCRPVYGLRQAPREWHDTVRTTLAALGFSPSSTDSSLAQRTITLTQSHMVHKVLQRFSFQFSSPQPTPLSTGHSLSAPPSDESVEPSGPYQELMGCLMYLMTTSGMGLVLGGRGPVVLTGHADASWVDESATQRSSHGYTFSLGSGSDSWRSTRSSSVISSSCEAEIYAGTMAAQELRWLTYLLIDFGEQPRSPPVLYVDNKAMIALCQEHRPEHRTKHIALRYFLAQELQQRGQLCLAHVATRANKGDIFTTPLPPACFAFLDCLRRPVYGLRQAPREWHDTLRTTLAALGFAPSTADPSLFLRTDTSLPPFYVLVYVDDLVFATADTAGLAHVKSELQKKQTCTDLGELRSYLGLQITRDRAQRTITLTQSHMVQQVLQRFNFTYSSPQATPLSTRHSLSALPSDESVEPSGSYPELVGCL
ncbi:unnamed protein product, partial [Closterium sp. NIES-53]